MLTIIIPETEHYDSNKNEFFIKKSQVIKLEHSLVSLSKWESKWRKPFLSDEKKTNEEIIEYIKCMTIGMVEPDVYTRLSNENIKEISEYINSPMTATWFTDRNPNKRSKEIVTSERIYYWMIAYNIPFECQKWHLNRLLTLIRICGIENDKQNGGKKMTKSEILANNRALNAQRRAKLNSKG